MPREYDPEYARQYYLRTRQLKGRKRGLADLPASRAASGKGSLPTSSKQDSPVQSITKERTEQLKARLEKLKVLLKQLLEEAHKQSGMEPPKKEDSPKDPNSSGSSGPAKPKTQAQKRAAKEALDKYKKEHKNDQPKEVKKTDEQLSNEIEQVRAKIKEIRQKIAESVAKAKEQAKSISTDSLHNQPVNKNTPGESK